MVCDFPAPLWPYASTAPLIPARTSSSVGRTASNTASLEAVGGKTASNENDGEPASVTSARGVDFCHSDRNRPGIKGVQNTSIFVTDSRER